MNHALRATLGASRKHARDQFQEHSDAELMEFELQAAQNYGAMIGAHHSLNDSAKRARRNAENTPLTSTKPW